MKQKILMIVALVAIGVSLGWYLHAQINKEEPKPTVYLNAEPIWVREPDCVPPNSDERRRTAVALSSLETFENTHDPMMFAAIKYFGHSSYWIRWEYKGGKRDQAYHVCRPKELYPRIAKLMVDKKLFRNDVLGTVESQSIGRPLFEEGLNLAAEIGPLHNEIVKSVANTAFYHLPIKTSALGEDIRSFARSVLAGYGEMAKPWADRAYDEISIDNALGTGAAQIAVAGRAPGALQKVDKIFRDLLGRDKYLPFDKVSPTTLEGAIPWGTRNVLYELAYAISMGGPKAVLYSEPIIMLLDYAVLSPAPPFGLAKTRPTRMCVVLKRIGGKAAEAASKREFCSNEYKIQEQG